MRFLVLGAGAMGGAAAHALARMESVDEVVLSDVRGDLAERAAAAAVSPGSAPVRPLTLEVSDRASVLAALQDADAALSAVPYFFNRALAELCIEARTHFCDLGGNNSVVSEELAMDALASAAGVSIVPDCGLAPGMVAVLVRSHFEMLDAVEDVHIRVGGLPRKPVGALEYQRVFSVHGLINEYVEPVVAIRNGEVVTLEPLVDVEALEFPEPFGKLEAFTTSGGTSTLPRTYLGKVRNLDYKTIRYPGHGRIFRALYELGFLDDDPIEVEGMRIAPRAVATRLLETHLPSQGEDSVLVRVESLGTKGGKRLRIRDQHVVFPNRFGHTAMMQMTSYPAAIVCHMMADGRITPGGARPQELCVPTREFRDELAKFGIPPEHSEERLA